MWYLNLKIIVGIAAVVSVLGIVFMLTQSSLPDRPSSSDVRDAVIEPASQIQSSVESKTSEIMITNGEKHLIPLDKIRGGGPPKDGIPSIDAPKFATIQGSQFVSDSDVVIGLKINGDARAYPLFILVWHEIVNDIVGDTPVSVTYCPLCYTSQVFDREVNGQTVEFGTSGKLYNSNLLMYDRLTDSYWSQGLGLAVKGELTGMQLKTIPFDLITWGDWKKLYPDTLVLTTDTGFIRSYATDPYGNYYTEPRIMFPVENKDERLHPKKVIIGLTDGQIYKAFPQDTIESQRAINDNVGDISVLLVSEFDQNTRVFDRTVNGDVLEFEYVDDMLIDVKTKSQWNYDGEAISGALTGEKLKRLSIHPGFWFEWVAFHPETLLYGDV